MSQTYGPYALTAGTRQQIAVSGQPGSIRISNQSTSLDLLVSFKTVPPAGTVAGGDWDLVVHAGWAESVPLMKDAQTPYALGAAWQGYLWVMPVSNAGQLAQAGTVPSLANCWVTTYAPGEPVQTGNPGPLGTSATSQQRVVTLPIAPVASNPINWQPAAANATLTLGFQFASAANKASGTVVAYIYGFELGLTNGVGGASAFLDFNIQAVARDNGNVVVGTFGFYRRVLWATNFTGTATSLFSGTASWFSPYPLVGIFSGLPNTLASVEFRLLCNALSAANQAVLNGVVLFAIDATNASAPGPIGNTTLQSVSGGVGIY